MRYRFLYKFLKINILKEYKYKNLLKDFLINY